jgi:flavodoxin
VKRILVTYFSLTGNTRAIAEAIVGALPEPKEIRPLAEVTDLSPYSLLFVGFPVHSHSVPYEVEAFLRRVPARTRIALFSTHGSLTGSLLARAALEYAIVCASQARVVGTFSCRGRVAAQALEVFKKSPEHEAWAEMAASAATHPDAADLEDAVIFARWVMTVSGSQRV